MTVRPHFLLRIRFHFKEHDASRRRCFGVGDDCQRQVPMRMDGVDGLNTVSLYFDRPGNFVAGDQQLVTARTIWPAGYRGRVAAGSRGQLWDVGYFAEVEILEIDDEALAGNLSN